MHDPAQPQSAKPSNALRATLVGAVAVVVIVAIVKLVLPKPAGSPEPIVGHMEVARTNLVLQDGRLRHVGTTNIFTGIMVEHYANGSLRSQSAVTNGLLHGASQGWFTNSQLQVEEYFRAGVSHGTRTKWYSSGAKESEATIVNGVLHGTFRKWHENGAPSEQAEMFEGRPEGLSLAWFPSRNLKARVLMKDGKVVEQTFWKDGEKIPN